MLPPGLRAPLSLLTLMGLLACGGSEPAASVPAAKGSTPTDAPKTDPKPADPGATPTPVQGDPKPGEVATPTAQEADEWLVWFAKDGTFTTRWIDAANPTTPLVAQRDALVLSDGQHLWRVHRQDADADVADCECLEQDGKGPACEPVSKLRVPGLAATDLASGSVVAIETASTELLMGGDIYRGIDVIGGAGPRLLYRSSDSGYYCGAHGMVESSDVIFDLAKGAAVSEPFKGVAEALPAKLRTPAAETIHGLLTDCEGSDGPSLTEVLDERMSLTGLSISAADGAPKLTWYFEAETYYACSPDYAASGDARSDLGAAPASLQLGAPLPAGVLAEIGRIGNASAVGWAKLTVTGDARKSALEAFGKASEEAWPPSSSSETPVAKAAVPVDAEQAKAKLNEGRKLTRAGEHAAAIALYDEAIALQPDLARAWSERGYAKLLSGDLAGAKADMEHALPLDEGAPYRASIHYNLGLVAERSGDNAAARAAFEKSLELRDNETVRKALERVK